MTPPDQPTDPLQLEPATRVLLRNRTEATITHYVGAPEPWEILGYHHDAVRTPALWRRNGRFCATPSEGKSPHDIVGIDMGEAPKIYAPFTGIEIIKK